MNEALTIDSINVAMVELRVGWRVFSGRPVPERNWKWERPDVDEL
jgi:hypothetical protein